MQRISIGDIDEMFNDKEFCTTLKESFKKQSSTVRHDPTQRCNAFYQKPSISQLMRVKKDNNNNNNNKRCPSIKKDERKHRWASLINEGRTEHHKRIPSEIEFIPIVNQYEHTSFLCRQSEKLIKSLIELPKNIQMVLHSLNYEIEKAEQKYILEDKFIFMLFNALQTLDKQILEPLFNGTRPVLNFKMKIVQESITVLADIAIQAVREAMKHDSRLGLFLEGLYKFWFVLVDIQLQWMGKSCQDYIEAQVKEFKQQFQEALNQKNKIEDQLIKMEKEFRIIETQYIRKQEALNQQLLAVQQEFQDYKVTVQQMSDLHIAEERMSSVGLKALELEHMFKQYDRVVSQHNVVFQKDIKELGNAILQQKKNSTLTLMKHQQNQQKLGCQKISDDNYQQQVINSVGIFMQIHPFCIDFQLNKDIELDYLTLLCHFLEHLTQMEDITINIIRIFIDWVNDQDKLNAIITYFIESEQDIPIIELYCILFGIRDHWQLSILSLKSLLKILRQLQDEHGFTYVDPIIIQDAFPYFQLLFDEQFNERIINTNKNQLSLIELLILLAQYYQMQDNKQWSEWFYNKEIISNELDNYMIKEFIEIRTQIGKPLDETLRLVRHLSLLHPEMFYKPKYSLIEKMKASVRKVQRRNSCNPQRSPTKRQSITLIKTASIKKQ